jgi:hypothetical protein
MVHVVGAGITTPILPETTTCHSVLGYDYVAAAMSDKKGDKSELPFEKHGSSLLSPLLSLIVAPT